MPRDGSITPADLVGKLDWLVVSCDKCGREGYHNFRPYDADPQRSMIFNSDTHAHRYLLYRFVIR